MKLAKSVILASWLLAAVGQGQTAIRGDEGGVLDAVGLDAPQTKSAEQLARDFAFIYRQETRDKLARIFQESSSSSRSQDPFGAPIGTTLRDEERPPEEDEVAQQAQAEVREGFAQAMRGLDIRGVNPGRGEFLIGADNVFEGDIIDVEASGKIYRAWVVTVKDEYVSFMDYVSRNMESVPLRIGVRDVPRSPWGERGTVAEAPPF